MRLCIRGLVVCLQEQDRAEQAWRYARLTRLDLRKRRSADDGGSDGAPGQGGSGHGNGNRNHGHSSDQGHQPSPKTWRLIAESLLAAGPAAASGPGAVHKTGTPPLSRVPPIYRPERIPAASSVEARGACFPRTPRAAADGRREHSAHRLRADEPHRRGRSRDAKARWLSASLPGHVEPGNATLTSSMDRFNAGRHKPAADAEGGHLSHSAVLRMR